MIRPKPDVPERYPILSFPTPEGQADLLFYELRDGDLPKNKAWNYGEPHPDAAKFPNHELVFVSAAEGGAGWQRWYYAANRENQHRYNWQFTDTTDWPQLAQTFIVRRSDFSVTSTYEMPPLDVIPYPLEWLATGIEERPINDETLASTFVTVVVTREKIRVRAQDGTYSDREIVGREFDPDTNSTTTYRRSKVPAGTIIPEGIQPDGSVVELQPVNTLWSIKNTKQAAGLAGKAVNGKASRTFQIITNWAWPAVLDSVRITPVKSDPGDFYSAITGYVTVPIYAADAYSGPCLATIIEEWTSKIPVIGGDGEWDSTKSTSPALPQPTPLLPKSIYFDSPSLRVNVPECLHGTLNFYEGNFEQVYPATTPYRWPGSVVAEVNLSANQGGWLKRIMIVNAPSLSGVLTELMLELDALNATSFSLKWNSLVDVYSLFLDISTDPTFKAGTFLSGFENKDVKGTVGTSLISVSRGVTYYCRLKMSRAVGATLAANAAKQAASASGQNSTQAQAAYVAAYNAFVNDAVANNRLQGDQSNTLAVTCPPQPEISLATPGVNWPTIPTNYTDLLTGGTLTFDPTQTSAPLTKTVIIRNPGLLPLSNLSVTFSAGDFSATGTIPTTIEPGQYGVVSVRFAPTTVGDKTGTMVVTSNAINNPSYTVNLTGSAVQPEIDVRYPVGQTPPASKPSGSGIALGSVNTGSSQTYVFSIHNSGNGNLTASISTSSTEPSLWQLTGQPSSAIPPNTSDEFEVTFSPGTSVGTKTLNISIISDDTTDAENPYILTLTAESIAVGSIIVASPDGAVLPDGTYDFGFSAINVSKAKLFTIGNTGVGTLTGITAALYGGGADQFILGTYPATVNSGSSGSFNITFRPTASTPTVKSAVLAITSSDPNRSIFFVNLKGTVGTDHEIVVESPPNNNLVDGVSVVKFGSVLRGSTPLNNFVIRNIGNNRLNLIGSPPVSVVGGDSAKFMVSALSPAVAHLDDGQSTTFSVTMDTTGVVGPLETTLQIFSQDTDEATFDVKLTGSSYASGSISTYQPSTLVIGQTSAAASINAVTASGLSSQTVPFRGVLGSPRVAINPNGRVAVADTAANRVLIWNSYASLATGAAANVVLGQPDFTTSIAQTSANASNLASPKAVAWYGNALLVADSGRNRILIWDNPPDGTTADGIGGVGGVWAANRVLGQAGSFTTATGNFTAGKFRGIVDICVSSGGKVIAADPENYRVLIWNTFPASNASPNNVIGQSSLIVGTDPLGARSYGTGTQAARTSYPSAVCVHPTSGKLFIADAAYQRVLQYSTIPTTLDAAPEAVLFQTDVLGTDPGGLSRGQCNAPSGLSINAAGHLAVADNGNRRVSIFYSATLAGSIPDAVVGQPDFTTNTSITRSELTLSDAYGVVWQGQDLLVTDRNRVAIFKP
jgi:hypothetical protein